MVVGVGATTTRQPSAVFCKYARFERPPSFPRDISLTLNMTVGVGATTTRQPSAVFCKYSRFERPPSFPRDISLTLNMTVGVGATTTHSTSVILNAVKNLGGTPHCRNVQYRKRFARCFDCAYTPLNMTSMCHSER